MQTVLLPAFLLALLGGLASGQRVYGQEVAKVAEIEIEEEQRVANFAVAQAAMQDPPHRLLAAYARVNAALARRVCQLSKAEEEQLARMDDAWIRQQLSEAVDSPARQAVAGIARFLQGRAQIRRPQPEQQGQLVERVKLSIDEHIDQALSDSHRATFRAECDARQKFRNESLAQVLVAALDSRLFLSVQQRQQLEIQIAAWYKKEIYWQFYFQNQNYVPDIPQSILTQVLTTEQLVSLKGARAWHYELVQFELQMMQEELIMIER